MKHFNKAASPQEQDILINAAITALLVTVVGMASNVIILLLGLLITLPAFSVGLANLNDQILWFSVAAVSLAFCFGFNAWLLTFIGAGGAQFKIGQKLSRKFRVSAMIATTGLGCAIHGLLCLFAATLSTSYLFFSGPVLYIARFIAKAERAFFAYDTDSYSFTIIITATVLYTIFCTAACCVGYRIGYRRKMALQEELEADERRGTAAGKTWSKADAEQASRVDDFAHTEEKVFLKTFERRTEEAYRAMNRRRIVKTAAFIVLWFAVDALLAYLWILSREDVRLGVDTMPFVALLIVPFFPMKLHKRLLGKTFYGEVVKIHTDEEARPGRLRGEVNVKRTQILLIRPDNGVPEEFRYPAGTHFDLAVGDRVFKLSAYPHPIPTLKRTAVGCPKCGHAAEERGAKKCPWCREPLAQWK